MRLLGVLLVCFAVSCRSNSSVTYETAAVDRGRIAPKVTATGTLSATVTVQVGSQVSGRVAALFADFNTSVDAGQVIARIDPQLFQAALEQSRANTTAADASVTRAKVQAADAERQFQRTQTLFQRQLVAQAEVDTALANSEAAKAAVEVAKGQAAQARAALHQAEVNLQYTTIVSPISGTVISRSVDVGQTVAASLSAPTLFVIAEDLKRMQVDTAVAEADVGKLREGMKASFTVDAFPTERFVGTVRQIRNAPTTVQNVVTYDAVIDVKNPELKLKPGMTANVTFLWEERNDVLRLPNAALRFRPPTEARGAKESGPPKPGNLSKEGAPLEKAERQKREARDPDEKLVWTLQDGALSSRTVKVGITDGTMTEVVSGLNEGDIVVTESNQPGNKGPPRSSPMGGGGMRRVF